MADKAEILTPLMRLRRRRRTAKAFGTILFVGLMTLIGVVLAVNDGRNYRRLLTWLGMEDYLARPFAAPPPPALRSRRATLVIKVSPRLIQPVAGMNDKLRIFPSLTAYERCERLGKDGPATSFQAAGGEWECLFSKELGAVPQPSVLFIQIKGTSSSTFRTFRLKLSLLDPGQDTEMLQLAIRSIDQFELELTPENRRYLDDRIRRRIAFSSRLGNYHVSYEPERGDDRRFNLLITQLPQISECGEPPLASRGAPMHSSITQMAIGCLPLPSPRSSGTIQAD